MSQEIKPPVDGIEEELLKSRISCNYDVNARQSIHAVFGILKAVADGELSNLSTLAIAEKLRISRAEAGHALERLKKGRGGWDYKQDAVVVQDQESGALVLSETSQEVAREGVSRFYARELMDLLQEMSKCSAETRRAIADELVASIGTDVFINREAETGEEHNKWKEEVEHKATGRNLWKESAQKMVADARKILRDIADALGRKFG